MENLDALGLIPGPDEQIEDFQKRATYCLNLSNEMKLPLVDEVNLNKSKELFNIFPTIGDNSDSSNLLAIN